MFNALASAVDVEDADVLDLYAGSGALGLEALSRGARSATFVESDRKALEVLRRNAEAVGLPGTVVLSGAVESVLNERAAQPYDIVLADPPYALTDEQLSVMLDRMSGNGWLAGHGVLVLERAARDGDPTLPAGLTSIRNRRYGDTATHWIGWTRAWD
jgi:16S rRNA (guanine966-N2)-methyltransferase